MQIIRCIHVFLNKDGKSVQKCDIISEPYRDDILFGAREMLIMQNSLFVGFKGKNNSSGILVQAITKNYCLLTNSFNGLKRDIDYIEDDYDFILMFGADKQLKSSLRVESAAEINNIRHSSILDLEKISECLNDVGIDNHISAVPTHYLCNEAYWYMLRKFNGKAAFIHIPTIKYFDDVLIMKLKQAFAEFTFAGAPL